MTEPFNIYLKLFLVGSERLIGSNQEYVFVSCWMALKLRYTSDGKISIGHNNSYKHIQLNSHMFHYDKASVKKVIETEKMKMEDFHDIHDMLSGIRLTDATVNNIFKRAHVTKAWVHKDWEIKNHSGLQQKFDNLLLKGSHSVQ